jgi:hypothetical protein
MGPTLRIALVSLSFVALGCSGRADAPITAPSGLNAVAVNDVAGIPVDARLTEKEVGLVDLSPGRVTRLEGEWRMRELPDGGPPGAWETHSNGFIRTVQPGDETPVPGGPSYRVEHEAAIDDPATVNVVDLWRQDRSGLFLYQEDVDAPRTLHVAGVRSSAVQRALAIIEQKRAAARGALFTDMPTRRATAAPGGPGPHEITFLRYPLHPNASWDGRPGFNVWTVEAKEWLDTDAGRFHAARLHIEVPGAFGPDDYAITWWAEPGEVKRHYHFLAPMTDMNGVPIGMFEFEETLDITQYAS